MNLQKCDLGHLSDSHSVQWGCGPVNAGIHPPIRKAKPPSQQEPEAYIPTRPHIETPPGQTPPLYGYYCKLYVLYWNAYLLIELVFKICLGVGW